MASTVQITERGRTAKIRNQWAVALLSLVTLGIYYLVWYYEINREMSDWGEQNKVDIGLSPGMSLLAVTVGAFLIIPPFLAIRARASECNFLGAVPAYTAAAGCCGSCCTSSLW